MDADGDLVTGAAGLDSEVSTDAGTFADCSNEATEIATSSGMYYLDLTSTEMNADTVAIIVKTSTVGAKTTAIVLYPEEAGDVRVDVVQWNGTAVTTPDVAGSPKVTVTSGAGAGQISLSAGAVLLQATQTGVTIPTVTTVTNGVTVTTNNDKTGYTASTVSDKTGYSLSAGGVQAIWDALTSALTTVGSIGKLLVDNINATISSRATPAQVATELGTYDAPTSAEMVARTLAAADYATAATLALVKAKTDTIPANPAAVSDIPTAVQNADALLARNEAGGSSTGRTVAQAIGRLRNRVEVVAGVLTVYAEDDVTPLWTAAVTTTAGDPVSGVDPV